VGTARLRLRHKYDPATDALTDDRLCWFLGSQLIATDDDAGVTATVVTKLLMPNGQTGTLIGKVRSSPNSVDRDPTKYLFNA
jgi:hypothetical protein